jgi:formate dehydrogenase major subunit
LYSTADATRPEGSVAALINLVLLCGQVGRPGAGIYPLAEHNNLQGVCDMGMLPDWLPGYRPVAEAGARAELEAVWGGRVPAGKGARAGDILAGRCPGIRALWLGRYDPVTTAHAGGAERTLGDLEFVVMQHLFWSGTAERAEVVLPTTAFGEESVTFTSTDRRIQRVRQAVSGPEGLEPAWRQIMRLAGHLGADWEYAEVEDVRKEIGRAVPMYAGISNARLDVGYGCPWPITDDCPTGTSTLFAADGPVVDRFRLSAVACPERPDGMEAAYPYTLIFGDALYYWHRNVLIRHSETLQREYRILLLDYPDGFVEVHEDDAREMGLRDGERIRLCTRHGCASTTARVTPEVRRGSVHVPYFLREVEDAILGREGGPLRLVPVQITKEAA